jgi:hypothetical protein
MRRGFEVDLRTGASLTITNNVVSEQGRPYPLFHQVGTSKMPIRRVIPQAGLPAHWKGDFDRTVRAHRDLAPKSCPGSMFPASDFQRLVAFYRSKWEHSGFAQDRIEAFKLKPYVR